MLRRPGAGLNRRGSARGVGGGAPYDPSQEAGYALDFWASYGITEAGTGVSDWVDQASGVTVSQGTDGKRPTYQATGLGGKPAVLFVAANSDGLTATSYANAATEWTIYCFCDPKTADTTVRDFLDSQTGRLIINQCNSNGNVGYYDGGFQDGGAATTGAQALVWHLASSGGGDVYRGSTLLGSDTFAGVAMGGNLGVGARFDAGGGYSDAAIGRILAFSSLHDAAARQRVLDWGAGFYGTGA